RFEVRDGFVPLTLGGEGGAEIGMRLRRAGVEGEGAAVAGDGLRPLALFGQNVAELGRGQCALRWAGGAGPEQARGLVQLSLLRERAAQPRARIGGAGIEGERLTEMGDGSVEVAPLAQQG